MANLLGVSVANSCRGDSIAVCSPFGRAIARFFTRLGIADSSEGKMPPRSRSATPRRPPRTATQCTPEEVCGASDPDLLPEVQARWAQIRRVAHQLDELFRQRGEWPSSGTSGRTSRVRNQSSHKSRVIWWRPSLGRGGTGFFKARQLKPNLPGCPEDAALAGTYASPQELAKISALKWKPV